MAGTTDECEILQKDEIEVLEVGFFLVSVHPTDPQSIYPSQLTLLPNPSSRPGRLLSISISIALPSSFPTILKQSTSTTGSSALLPTLEIAHLPPITVRLLLPPSYPLQLPPKVLSLRANLPDGDLRHHWMEKNLLGKVENRMIELWEEEKAVLGEGAGVMWRWWEWIGVGDFLTDLGCIEHGELR